jgi:DNA-directed RNA polymerase subunit RPC12/RpoP
MSPATAEQSATKFYFCETCGKRITDRQILEGLGRDKKLKGVYCKDCAVGVMTMEFGAIKEVPSKPVTLSSSSGSKQGSSFGLSPAHRAPANPASKPSVRIHGQATKPVKAAHRRAASLAAIGGSAVALLTIFAIASGPSNRSNQSYVANKAIVPVQHLEKPVAPKDNVVLQPLADKPQMGTVPVSQNPESKISSNIERSTTMLGVESKAASAPTTEPAIAELSTQPAAQPISNVLDSEPKKKEPNESNAMKMDESARQKQLAIIQTELAPLLRRNQFSDAEKLLNEKLNDPAVAGILDLLKREKCDLAQIQELRSLAIDALRAKVGAVVALKKGTMTGTVKVEPNTDRVALALKDGPELAISASQLDAADVCNLVPLDSGAGQGEGLRRRGLLCLAAGETAKAEDYFIKVCDAGGDAAQYLERIEKLKSEAAEVAAAKAWNEAQQLADKKQWQPLVKALVSFERLYGSTEFAPKRRDEIQALQARAGDAIAAADGNALSFNFETADNFARFKKLFTVGTPNNMEMKYEHGKVIFHSADRENGGDYFLKAESVKLGTNWEMIYRINTNIGIKEINGRPYERTGIDIRFEHASNGKLIHSLDGYTRFSMSMLSDFDGRLVCRLVGPGVQDNSDDSAIFKGMKSTGISRNGCLSQGKATKPASLDGTYDVALTMRNGHMKIVVNGSVVIDDALPEALSHQIESGSLMIFIWSIRQDLELERFKFNRLPSGE